MTDIGTRIPRPLRVKEPTLAPTIKPIPERQPLQDWPVGTPEPSPVLEPVLR